jgi:hypothetical protein
LKHITNKWFVSLQISLLKHEQAQLGLKFFAELLKKWLHRKSLILIGP